MKAFRYIIFLLSLLCACSVIAGGPKREFRGAWLHTVWQEGYHKRTTAQNKAYLINQLDSLKAAGVNAVLFQVRPQADAFYASELEPWSCYLTDGGKAPVPFWDPLQFMVEECHKRAMELHAWLNPYRVTSNTKQISTLPSNHIYHKHPERFVKYADGKLYFDPALPENRDFIGRVVEDIVSRYDVDGIHFDDYFYPYPVAGKDFPDEKSYAKYGQGMKRDDWRRHNVDLLIEDVHNRITALKPWVRFGVSPFGIYRNKKTDPRGSNTSGLQNYDALYADVLLWDKNGWVDYLLPQLYWDLYHKSASTLELIGWWNDCGLARHLYIGQDVQRTMDKKELATKVSLSRIHENVQGNCWWPGYSVTANVGGVADSLATDHQSAPALCPSYPWISSEAPRAVHRLHFVDDGAFAWSVDKAKGRTSDAVKFAIYRFDTRSEIDIDAYGALIDIVSDTTYKPALPGVYVVTAIDRVNNESEPSKPIFINF